MKESNSEQIEESNTIEKEKVKLNYQVFIDI